MITLASVALVSGASAQIASPVLLSFSDIGADAVQIAAAGGQTFADIGALTGLSDYDGISLTLEYVADGTGTQFVQVNGINNSGAVASQPGGNSFNFGNGTVFGTWSVPVEFETRLGRGLANNEFLSFGPVGNGGLISTHTEAGLTVSDDAVSNESGATIVSAENPLWYTAASTNFTATHDGAANASGFIINLGTPAPEPSSALLVALSALGFIGRRKR